MLPDNSARPMIGVSALVFDTQERVLLIRRAAAPAAGYWHAPGGKLEAGESLVAGCQREVREETGIEVRIGPILAVVERRIEGFHYVIIDFLGHLVGSGETLAHAGDDALEAAWIAESDLIHYPIAAGLLPIIACARLAHRGQPTGLVGSGPELTDFLPSAVRSSEPEPGR